MSSELRCCFSPALQGLAAEVVELEERVLQAKSSHLRDRSQASGASEVVRAMQVCVLVCARMGGERERERESLACSERR